MCGILWAMNGGNGNEPPMMTVPAPSDRRPGEMDSAKPAVNPVESNVIQLVLDHA
jgi:hypothetical protein